MAEQTIAVIIPCYNEAVTIGKVIDDFHRELPQATVYVYDNNSSDDTSRIAAEHGATVRFEPRQKGQRVPPDVSRHRRRLLPDGRRR